MNQIFEKKNNCRFLLIDQVRHETNAYEPISILDEKSIISCILSVRRILGNCQFRSVSHVTPSITWNESWSNRFSIQVVVAPLSQRSLQFPWDPSSFLWEYLCHAFCIFCPKTYSRAKIQRPKIQEFCEKKTVWKNLERQKPRISTFDTKLFCREKAKKEDFNPSSASYWI